MRLIVIWGYLFLLTGSLQAQNYRQAKQAFETYYNKNSKLCIQALNSVRKNGYVHPTTKAIDEQISNLHKNYGTQFKLALKRHGWLTHSKVGLRANRGFFMWISSADSATIKTFLPIIKKAWKAKQIDNYSYAKLYDRMLVAKGKRQYYGTQYYWDVQDKTYYYNEIDQIDSVNRRRTSIGLEPLELKPRELRFISDKVGLLPHQHAGTLSYADTVLKSYYSGAHADFNQLYGGQIGVRADIHVINPNVVTQANDKFVSLPTGSYVIVGFGDNSVIDAPNQPDLFIEETGPAGDKAKISVSADGKNFVLLGIADDGKQTTFDLASIGFKQPVIAVKIEGLDFNGFYPGFDLVSVRALIGAVGEAQPAAPWYVPTRLPKRLKNVLFAFDKSNLTLKSQTQVDKVLALMKKYPGMSLELIGHTDMVGNHSKNLQLSQKRVENVYNYMLKKGITPNKLHKRFFGKQKPLYTNKNPDNQALNRRVEFRLM